jgi:hypothetical protein
VEWRGGGGEYGTSPKAVVGTRHPPVIHPTYPSYSLHPTRTPHVLQLSYTNTNATACIRAYRVVAGGVVTAFFLALAGGEVAEASGLARVVERFRILCGVSKRVHQCMCIDTSSMNVRGKGGYDDGIESDGGRRESGKERQN